MTTRRGFLGRIGALGALAGFAPQLAAQSAARAAEGSAELSAERSADGAVQANRPNRAPMSLLILGGTGFIGPHIVREAIARGHIVSIFTRGRSEADLPASVERLIGDRDGQLSALEGRRWDAVIDDSATNPEWVRQSTALLAASVGRYLFTSSTGVYYPYLQPGATERSAVRRVFTDENDGAERYGVQKVQCEDHVLSNFGARGLVVRPTYIVGPGDTTDRFPYWPQRLARGGDTLAPGRRTDPVQLVDVRDLARFMISLLESEREGIFNVAGPASTLTIEDFLESAMRAVGSTSTLVWVDDYDLLTANRIRSAVPWIMLSGNELGHTSASNARALEAGLLFRPLGDTVRDTLSWWNTVPEERRTNARFTISAEKEAHVLAEWRARLGAN